MTFKNTKYHTENSKNTENSKKPENSKNQLSQQGKIAVLRMYQINENYNKKQKYRKQKYRKKQLNHLDEKLDLKSPMIDTTHHKKTQNKGNKKIFSSVCPSDIRGIQNAWSSIQYAFSNCASDLIFESRKEECLDIIASVQRAWNNYHQYAQQNLNVRNASDLFLDLQKVEYQLQKTQNRKILFDISEWKKLEQDIQHTTERLFQFLFDYNDDLFALLIYKTKKGHIRSRIPELFFYASLYSYAQKHLHCNIWNWLKAGIFDSHILRLSNREHPETSKYKEVIFDAMMRESYIFSDDTYHKTQKEIDFLSSFEISDSWSVTRFPMTQFIYQDIMGNNHSYFQGWSKPVEMLSIDELFVFCNRLSRKMGFQPVYVPIKMYDTIILDDIRTDRERQKNHLKEQRNHNKNIKNTKNTSHQQVCTKYETLLEDRKKEIIQSQCTHVYYEVGLYTTWLVDWKSDGYRLPDTHEIMLLSVLQQTSQKSRKNLLHSGWYIENSMLHGISRYATLEDDIEPSERNIEEEHWLLAVLGEERYRQLSLHETKIAGQKKSTRFDIFDQIGNVADLAIDYSHPKVLHKKKRFLGQEKTKQFFINLHQNPPMYPSEVEADDLVILDLQHQDYFYSMGNHIFSEAYKIFPQMPNFENFNWKRPFINPLMVPPEPLYVSMIVDSARNLGTSRRRRSENCLCVPYVGLRLVRGRCFYKSYKNEYDPTSVTEHIQKENSELEQLSLPGISVSSQSGPQKGRYYTPRNILEYLQAMGHNDSNT